MVILEEDSLSGSRNLREFLEPTDGKILERLSLIAESLSEFIRKLKEIEKNLDKYAESEELA